MSDQAIALLKVSAPTFHAAAMAGAGSLSKKSLLRAIRLWVYATILYGRQDRLPMANPLTLGGGMPSY